MNKAEAKRRVCRGAALLLGDDGENMWLWTDEAGKDLSEADVRRMSDARDELVTELRRRATQHDPPVP